MSLPTAIGLTSRGQPSLILFRAMSPAPATNLAIEGGAFPVKRMLSKGHIGVGSGMLAASSKCCTRRPEGPAAVSLGKECRMDKML